jgi:putative acetyltransferase
VTGWTRAFAMLRDAQVEDLQALADLAAASYRVAFAEILEPEAMILRGADFFVSIFATALPQIRLAEEGGQIAAFAKTTGTHLDMLFTAPAFQGRGHGAALLAEAEARHVCSLEAFAANLSARAFYERRGWRLTRSYERDFIGRSRAFVLYEKARQD